MNPGIVAFLLGLFGVPLALLITAHKWHQRSARARGTFWGATIGHCVAAIPAVVWPMIPPEAWVEAETARGVASFWALLALPLLGAGLGAVRKQR
jgi:hypothetical protein